jgi:hypothetical protein
MKIGTKQNKSIDGCISVKIKDRAEKENIEIGWNIRATNDFLEIKSRLSI